MTRKRAMQKEIKRRALLPRIKTLLLVVLLLVSCDGTVYHRFEQVDDAGWMVCDTLSFLYEPGALVSGGEAMDVTLQVRYGADYRFKNLYACVETFRARDSVLLSVDTLCCCMYDDNGRRLGYTAGTIYQNSSEPVTVAVSPVDTLLFKVTHIMDVDSLKDVFDVGLRLANIEM